MSDYDNVWLEARYSRPNELDIIPFNQPSQLLTLEPIRFTFRVVGKLIWMKIALKVGNEPISILLASIQCAKHKR